jgi:hypothetical protein
MKLGRAPTTERSLKWFCGVMVFWFCGASERNQGNQQLLSSHEMVFGVVFWHCGFVVLWFSNQEISLSPINQAVNPKILPS